MPKTIMSAILKERVTDTVAEPVLWVHQKLFARQINSIQMTVAKVKVCEEFLVQRAHSS